MTIPNGKITQNGAQNQHSQHYNDVAYLPDYEEKDRQEEQARQEHKPDTNEQLRQLLELEKQLAELSEKPIIFRPSLISRNGYGIISRSTVNLIQGAYGAHKSRLAELLGSLILSPNPNNDPQFIGFEKAMAEWFCLCYIDTERNRSEELPYALQNIKIKAGYQINERPDNFRFTSIKGIDRSARLNSLQAFISHVRESTDLHLFCIIDVATDAIGDFNDTKESLRLYDFLGNLCDNYDATFLLVVHQNPGSEKARGHTGSEGGNKASAVLQIGFEKTPQGEDSKIVRLRFLKLRRGERPEPIFLQFSKETNGLELVEDYTSSTAGESSRGKPAIKVTEDTVSTVLNRAFSKDAHLSYGQLTTAIAEAFQYVGETASQKTIRELICRVVLDEKLIQFRPEKARWDFYKINIDKQS